MRPKGALERVVKKAVKKALTGFHAYQFWPVPCGIGASTVDCIACVPVEITAEMVGTVLGVFVAIETKREATGKPTKMQAATKRQDGVLDAVRVAGGVGIVVHSTSIDATQDAIIGALSQGG